MIDNYIEGLNKLLVSKEAPLVENVKLSTEEILTCAGLVIAAPAKWSAQRDMITSLMLNVDEESMEKVLMFVDIKAIESAIPKC